MHAETTLREGTIYNAYGLTESLLNTCLAGDEMADRPTSAGRACVGTAVRILGDDLQEVGTGLVGEVVVNCTAMATDYLGQTAAWEATTIDDGGRKWYRTGDLGYLDESGYLFLVDRAKDMILSGGENIYSAEVERIVLGHPGIDDVAVIGTPDERWGELVTAAVVLHDGWTIESLDLDTHCREELAAYKRPRRVIALDMLPRNSFGKVLKNALRDQFATGGAS
jgi:fatty-acyl-CoA synthase